MDQEVGRRTDEDRQALEGRPKYVNYEDGRTDVFLTVHFTISWRSKFYMAHIGTLRSLVKKQILTVGLVCGPGLLFTDIANPCIHCFREAGTTRIFTCISTNLHMCM